MNTKLSYSIFLTCFPILLMSQGNEVQQKGARDHIKSKAEVGKFLGTLDFEAMIRFPGDWSSRVQPADRKQILIELSSRLNSKQEIGLDNYADLIIWSRVDSGKMIYPGHGTKFRQDVFLENGRCAWAIEQMLNCRLPDFSVKLNEKPDQLAEAVRESLLKVIESMAMPESPQPKK